MSDILLSIGIKLFIYIYNNKNLKTKIVKFSSTQNNKYYIRYAKV